MGFDSKIVAEGYSFDDVLLRPQLSSVESRSDPTLETPFAGDVTLDIPLMSAAMDTVTSPELAIELDRLGGIGVTHRFQTVEQQAAEVAKVAEQGAAVAGAIGINEDWVERSTKLVESGADALVVDVAHGHMTRTLDVVDELTEIVDVPVVAGNVVTPEGAQDLVERGADGVKVGVGPGAYCTTREVAGVGVPQLTAVGDCADAVPDDVTIIADGGIRTSADAGKALMAGADSVMMGSFFAGTREAPGEVIELDSDQYKQARGMATTAANEARNDKDAEEAAPDADEGVQGVTPYVGSVIPRVEEFTAGIRSTLSYLGGHSIPEARENAEFVEIMGGAKKRNGAHYDR